MVLSLLLVVLCSAFVFSPTMKGFDEVLLGHGSVE